MRKGISPIIAVVLLIAISVISAMGVYFWMAGTATKQPTPETTNPITITPVGGGKVLIANLGSSSVNTSTLQTSDPNIKVVCEDSTILPGKQVLCTLVGETEGGTVVIYGEGTGSTVVELTGTQETSTGSNVVLKWYPGYADWPYRQAISISGSGQTDYQLAVDLDSSSVGSNFNWSDSDSIRFTWVNSSTGDETPIPYWIEYWDSVGKKARIWIRVPEIGTSTTVYMYYGNPSATSESNVTAVFVRVIPGLIAYWDGSTNLTRVLDVSGNGHDGKYSYIKFGSTGFASYEGKYYPENGEGVGVLGTDGTYIYGKSWGTYDGPDNNLTKIGSGFGGTTVAKDYGDITNVSGSLSGFYLDGYFYNGYTTNGTTLERVNLSTGEVDYVVLGAPLLRRDTGTNIGTATSAFLVTTDSRYVYNLAYGVAGTTYAGWTLRIFDPYNNWSEVKTITFGNESYYTDGIIADGNYIYAIQWSNQNTNNITAFDLNGNEIAKWQIDQTTTQVINGQYDWVNNKVWLGGLRDLGNQEDSLYRWQGHADKVSGMRGDAIAFDGYDDYLDVGNVFSTALSELSIEARVKVDQFNQPPGVTKSTPIVSGWNAWLVDNQKGYLLRALHSSVNVTSWNFAVCDGTNYDGVGFDQLNDSDFAAKYAGKWVHLAGTFAPESLKLYLNGTLGSSKSTSLTQVYPDTSRPDWIGRTSINPGLLDGTVDELRIYNRELTADEIADLYANSVYVTENYAGYALVRRYSATEPSYSLGSEESI